MEEYKSEIIAGIEQIARENPTTAKEWLDSCRVEEGDFDENFDYDLAQQLDFLRDISWADELTGNASGSYYCNSAKAQEAVVERDMLTDEGFIGYLRDCDTHLEDLLERGYETLDVWCRCYIIDYKLSGGEVLDALKAGLLQAKNDK